MCKNNLVNNLSDLFKYYDNCMANLLSGDKKSGLIMLNDGIKTIDDIRYKLLIVQSHLCPPVIIYDCLDKYKVLSGLNSAGINTLKKSISYTFLKIKSVIKKLNDIDDFYYDLIKIVRVLPSVDANIDIGNKYDLIVINKTIIDTV